MVQINVLGGYDNVTFPPGATNQSTVAALDWGGALESYGSASLGNVSPSSNNYLGWTMTTEDATSSVAVTTGNGWLMRVIPATGGPCGHLDVPVTSALAVTNAVFGIYSGPSFAVGPLAWTADVHATITGAAGLYGLTWNGASSPASVNLVAGQTYWIYMEITGTTPTISGSSASGLVLNANLTASASFADNAMTNAAANTPPTTLAANTTLAPQTNWAPVTGVTGKFWFGLRA